MKQNYIRVPNVDLLLRINSSSSFIANIIVFYFISAVFDVNCKMLYVSSISVSPAPLALDAQNKQLLYNKTAAYCIVLYYYYIIYVILAVLYYGLGSNNIAFPQDQDSPLTTGITSLSNDDVDTVISEIIKSWRDCTSILHAVVCTVLMDLVFPTVNFLLSDSLPRTWRCLDTP